MKYSHTILMKYLKDSTAEEAGKRARGCVTRRAGALRGAVREDVRARCGVREIARRGREGMSAKRENTPMSDNLLKKRIHCTQNLYILQII